MFKLAISFRGGIKAATIAVVASLVAPAGCAKPKPPPPPKVEPEPEPPPPPPPPPPKCEALDEGCEADEDTLLPVPGTTLVFTPPAGWTYAKLEAVTLVQKSDAGALIVVGSHPWEKVPFKRFKGRSEYGRTLLEQGELETPRKLQLNAPQQRDQAGEIKLGQWITHDTKRGDAKGELLSFAGQAGEQEVVGVAFAPEDDDEAIGAILDAIKTLHTRTDVGDDAGEEGDEGEDDEAK